MLRLVDSGCQQHELVNFKLHGLTTLVVMGIVSNLPQDGNYHTYVCEHGRTHRLSFQIHKDSSLQRATGAAI
jgi:hypothetical protein